MAYLQLPSGQYLEIPAGMDAAQAAALAQQQFPNEMLTPDEKSSKQGFFPALGSTASQFIGGTEKTAGSLFGYKPLETLGEKTTAEAGNDYIPTSSEDVDAGVEKGLGSGLGAGFSRFVSEPLGSLVGSMGAPVAAGVLASLAAPVEGITSLGVLGTFGTRALLRAAVTSAANMPAGFSENLDYQKHVNPDIPEDKLKAVAADLGQSALLGFGVPTFGVFPKLMQGMLGKDIAAMSADIANGTLSKDAALGQLSGTYSNFMKNAASNYVGLEAMGAGSEALQRWQAGQDVTSPEALNQYTSGLATGIAPALLFGGWSTLGQRGKQEDIINTAANKRTADQNAEAAGIRASFFSPKDIAGVATDYHQAHANILDAAKDLTTPIQEGEEPEDFLARQTTAAATIKAQAVKKAQAEQAYRTMTGTPVGDAVDIPKPAEGVVQSNQDILATQIAAISKAIEKAYKNEDTNAIASLSQQLSALQQKLVQAQTEPVPPPAPPITPEEQALKDELNQEVINPPIIQGKQPAASGISQMQTGANETIQPITPVNQEQGATETPAVASTVPIDIGRPTLNPDGLYIPSDITTPVGAAETHVAPDSSAAVAARDLLERSTWAPLPGESETKDTVKARIGLPEMRKVGKDLGLDVSGFTGKGADVREMALGKIRDEVAYLDNLRMRGTGRDVLPGVQEQQIEPRIAQAVADKREALNNLYTGLYGLHGSPDTAAPQLHMSALDKINEKLANPNLSAKERIALQAEKAQVKKGSTFRTALQEAFAKAQGEKGTALTSEEKSAIKEDIKARKNQRRDFTAQVKDSKEAYHDAALRESAYTRLRRGNEPLTKDEAGAYSAKVKEALDIVESRSKPEVGRVNTALNVRDNKVTAPTLDALHYELHKNDKAVAPHTQEKIITDKEALQKGTPWAPIGENIAAAHSAYTEPAGPREKVDTAANDAARIKEQKRMEHARQMPGRVITYEPGYVIEKITEQTPAGPKERFVRRKALQKLTDEQKERVASINKELKTNPELDSIHRERLEAEKSQIYADATTPVMVRSVKAVGNEMPETNQEKMLKSVSISTQMRHLKEKSSTAEQNRMHAEAEKLSRELTKQIGDLEDLPHDAETDKTIAGLRSKLGRVEAALERITSGKLRMSPEEILIEVNKLERKAKSKKGLTEEQKERLAELKSITGVVRAAKFHGDRPGRESRPSLLGMFNPKEAEDRLPVTKIDTETGLPLASKGAKPTEGIGRQGVIDELKGYGAVGTEGHKVQVHETVADFVKDRPEYEGKIDSTTKGMVHKGQAHLFGENIGRGEAQGVFLHEVGAHIGMKNMMPEGAYKGIASKIFDWANKNDGSIESRVAKAAMDRINDAGVSESQKHDEAIAYTVEEAIKAGVKPADGPLGTMLQRIKQWATKAFEKWFGELPKKEMSLQDLVDMAHGAAKVEMGTGIHDEGRTAEPLFSKKHADSDLVNAVTGKDAEKPAFGLTMFRIGLGLRSQIVDKAAAYAKILERVGDNIHDKNYKAAFQMLANIRNYHNSMTHVTEIMSHGGQLFNTEFDTGRGYKQYWPTAQEGAGRVGLPAIANELKKITGYSADQLDGLMKTYMSFKREDANPEWKGKLGINVDPARRAEFVKKWDADPHMQEARKLYDIYNKNLVNGLRDAGVLTPEEATLWNSRKDFVPYYRMNPNGNLEMLVEGDKPRVIGDLKNQPWLQELVGGNRPVGGFAEDAMRNTHMLVTSMLHNLASSQTAQSMRDLGIATKVGAGLSGKDVIHFRDKGVMQAVKLTTTAHSDFSDIPVEMLIKGLEGTPQMNSMFLKMMRAPAKATRFLTEMNPLFAARVLVRHSPFSWLTSGSNATPFIEAIKHVIADIGSKDTSSSTLRRAGVGGGGALHYGDPDAPAIMRYAMGDRSSFTVLGKVLSFFEKNVVRADMGTRATLYDDFLKQGLSKPEAFYASLESMNFSRRGASGSVNSYIQTIPFMNALMQGLDVFYRAARGQMPFNKRLDVQGKLFRRAALISASSVGYALAVRTNPDYQKVSEEDRLKNWLIFGTPGEEPYKFPLMFEPGIFVKSVPEAMVALMHGDAKINTVTRALGNLVLQSVPGGLPEAISPLVSLGMNNENVLSSQQIENQRLQHLLKPERYLPETSELAKAVGQYTGNPWIKQHLGFTEGLSPVQLDYIAKEYLGSMGEAFISLFNHVGIGAPRPTMLPHQVPILGGMRQDVSGNGILGDFLDGTAQASQMKATITYLEEIGQKDKAAALLKKYPEWLGEGTEAAQISKDAGDLSRAENMITASTAEGMTPEKKRMLINNYRAQKAKIIQQIKSSNANKQ